MKIQIVNGPNLNLLGKREPDIYGNTSFEDYFARLQQLYPNCELSYFQSNHEGDIIDKIHIINAGAYTHTSIAIHDAIKAVKTPVLEVHISNIHTREEFRHKSMIAPACKGSLIGLGLLSYDLAIDFFLKKEKA